MELLYHLSYFGKSTFTKLSPDALVGRPTYASALLRLVENMQRVPYFLQFFNLLYEVV
jgi:hypothetical protein